MIERVVIDVDGAEGRPPADAARPAPLDAVRRRQVRRRVGRRAVEARTAAQVAFVSTSRDHKQANAARGRRRRPAPSARSSRRRPRPSSNPATAASTGATCPASNEVDLVLASATTGASSISTICRPGKLKNPITSGDGNVTQLLRVDETDRTALLPGRRPRAGPRSRTSATSTASAWTARAAQLLTPEDADHDVSLSPSGKYFVDNYSKPDVPPVVGAARRDRQAGAAAREGRHLAAAGHRLEAADADHGEGARRRRPISTACCTGRPTSTRRRSTRSSTTSIPGPQTGSVGSRSFSAARGDSQALAELGFVVVEIDGMGTPWRSKRFHAAYYGDMGDNTLPDQVAGMKELAARYPWIDIDRAGIYGHSGGGYATAAAMFRYPDFFKVGVSRGRQPRQPRLRRRLGREVAGPAREEARRHDQLRQPGEPELSRRT